MAASSSSNQPSERVQAFSVEVNKIETPNDTELALISHVKEGLDADRRFWEDRIQWRQWWQEPELVKQHVNDDNSLMGQCKEVTEVWKAFCGKRSSRRILQRVNISIADGMKPPSIDVLHRVIRGLDEQRQIRQGRLWGKTKANLLAFASTMDAHKALLSFFPSENIYTSVLSGVVSTVVLASVNHKKAAEGYSRGFKEIGDNLAYLADSIRSLDTPRARKSLANAYVEVFKFLCSALHWAGSLRHRMNASIQASFYQDHIKSHIDEIKRLAEIVDRDMGLQTHNGVLDLLDIGRALESSDQKRSAATRFRKRDDGEREQHFTNASKEFSRLGLNVTDCLHATEEQHNYDQNLDHMSMVVAVPPIDAFAASESEPSVVISESTTIDSGEDDIENEADDLGHHHYSRAQVEGLAVSIKAFVGNGVEEVMKHTRQDPDMLIPTEVLIRIQDWLGTATSSFLWIEGPGFPSDLSPTSLHVCSVLVNQSIPCIPFFDRQRYHNPWRLEVGQAGVVCFLYTLINDLICQLPSVIGSGIVLDQELFSLLDGSWTSIEQALTVIQALLAHINSGIVFVFNGIEAVDDSKTCGILKNLIQIIRDHSSKAVVKTLFITNGMSQALGQRTTYDERVDASRPGYDRPGRPPRGGSSLSQLQLDNV